VTNFYLMEDGGRLTLIDAGTPKDWEVLVNVVEGIGHRIDDLETVLLTHAHADHTGVAERARTEAGARVLIHKEDEHAASTGEVGKPDGGMGAYLFKIQMYRTMLSLGRRGAAKIVPIHEVSAFSDGEILDVPGRPRVIHAPGHTDGSSALMAEKQDVLFAGDVLSTWNPLTGRRGPQIMPAAMNHDTDQALRSLSVLDGVTAGVMLPGHGEPWTGGMEEALSLARAAGRS
jgi:glyoxylase-like metal-dependent hydrolase (beta-lactamase superfamily II)